MTKKLSNDTIVEMFKAIDGKLDTIHEQTVKTNGRVNTLESWKDQVMGAIKIISLFAVPVMLYVGYIIIDKIWK